MSAGKYSRAEKFGRARAGTCGIQLFELRELEGLLPIRVRDSSGIRPGLGGQMGVLAGQAGKLGVF